MTDKQWDSIVYVYDIGADAHISAATLRISTGGLYTCAIANHKRKDKPIDIPTVAIDKYYQDNGLSLQDIVEKVNQGKMHPRAIAIAMDLLL